MLQNRRFYDLSEPVNYRFPKIPLWLYLAIVPVCAGLAILIAQVIGGLVLLPVYGATLLNGMPGGAGQLVALLIASFLPIFGTTWLLLQFFEKRGLVSVGMQTAGAARNYGRGLLIGLAMLGGSVLIMSLLGFTAIENPLRGASVAGALFVFLGWMVQGAAEEVITRGFVLQIFGRTTNTIIAVIVSSVIFAALHAFNANITFLAVLNLFLFGVFAALYTIWEGGLWGIFAIHSVWNWAQGNLFGFEVSGNVIESAIVLDLMETGPDQLTGGAFGPEGGLLVTIVLLVAMALVWRADQSEM